MSNDRRAGHLTPEQAADRRIRADEARKQSLYNQDADAAFAANRSHLTRTVPLRWAPGIDPHDPEAQPGSGWEYKKLEVLEHQEQEGLDPFKGVTGVPVAVRCLNCGAGDYLIVDEHQVEGDAEVKWSVHMNRPVDPVKIPKLLLLFCPLCKEKTQLREEVVSRLTRHD